MPKKRKLSSNSKGVIIVLFLLFFQASFLVLISQEKAPLWDSILFLLIVGGITVSIGLFYFTRDEVEYDGAFFYIYNRRKKLKHIVPIENISSMIWYKTFYRFYYLTENGEKSYFTMCANIGFTRWQLEKELKKANAYFFSVQAVFGFEHLIFYKEEWFK